MKVVVKLDQSDLKVLKKYITETDGVEKPVKDHVQALIDYLVTGLIMNIKDNGGPFA